MYKDAAGVWHQDRFRPLIAAMVNLFLNIILVQFWGIYAILLSTIISYVFISMPWMISNVFKYVFHRSWKQFMKEFVTYFIAACIITFLCCILCRTTRELSCLLYTSTRFFRLFFGLLMMSELIVSLKTWERKLTKYIKEI